MSRKIIVSLTVVFLMSLMVSVAQAQRPTPTDLTPVPPETTPEPASSNKLGTVRGFVYLDVNGDGRCVNTGVVGEEAVVGIPVEFVSSDEKHTITNTSAINGAYELAGAGLSYWRVTAKPDNNWVVTSQNPLYAPVTEENLAAVDVNFCVAKAGTAVYPLIAPVYTVPTTGDYFLPESGAAAPTPVNATLWLALLGLAFIAVGVVWRGMITLSDR